MIHSHDCLFHLTVEGDVGTNSSKKEWKQDLERELSQVPSSLTFGKKLAVKAEFWISPTRVNGNKLDCDNLAKPLLDAIKNVGLVYDDSLVYDLHVTKHTTTANENLVLTVSEWWT